MSEADNSLIKQGFWINYSEGSVLGATITTNQRTANVVVALMAVIVSAAAGSVWNLVMFSWHQLRATSQPRDGLYRQQQVLLRTLATPGSVLADTCKLLWTWRGNSWSSTFRCFPLLSISLTFAIASLAASIFSSYVIDTADLQVLVEGRNCRNVNLTAYITGSVEAATKLDTELGAAALGYSSECYGSSSLPPRCQIYVQPRIISNASASTCPFESSICFLEGSASWTLDSGYLDSNDAFGLNAPRKDRVQLRRVSTCAPLQTSKYMQLHDVDEPGLFANATVPHHAWPGEQIWTWNYGSGRPIPRWPDNGTVGHSSVQSNTSDTFQLFALGAGWFDPIDELLREDAQVTLIFVFGNAIRSYTPIDDPMYSAHQKLESQVSGYFNASNGEQNYHFDLPAGVLGCTEQYQYCHNDPNGKRKCTPPMAAHVEGYSALTFRELLPEANERQIATLEVLGVAAWFATLMGPTGQGDLSVLNAAQSVIAGTIPGLPRDQWIRDFRGFENFVLAMLQISIVQSSFGYPGASDEVLSKPNTPEGKLLCRSQKVVKTGGFANISVFGLAFTLAATAVLMLLDFGVLRCVILLDKVKHRLSPGVQYWIDDGVYQLQSAAYDALGEGTWTRPDKEIPRTLQCDRFRPLPPKISVPRSAQAINKMPNVSPSQSCSAHSSAAQVTPARTSMACSPAPQAQRSATPSASPVQLATTPVDRLNRRQHSW